MGSLQQYSKRTNHGSTRNLHDEKLPLLTETLRHVRKTGSQLASVPQGFTSKFTALSAITFSPAAGVCATMMLVGDAEGGGLGIARSAARSLRPNTSGVCARSGPRLSAARSRHPRRTRVSGCGSCDMIFPSVISGL